MIPLDKYSVAKSLPEHLWKPCLLDRAPRTMRGSSWQSSRSRVFLFDDLGGTFDVATNTEVGLLWRNTEAAVRPWLEEVR